MSGPAYTVKQDVYNRKSGAPSIYTGVPTIEFDEDRREKPWQRVPSTLIVLVLAIYLLLAYLTQLVEDEMPKVVKELDVTRDDPYTFSEEAAWRYLNITLGDQPRVSGTKYHLQKTKDLKQLVDSIASQANLPVRTDWQFADGDYWMEFSPPFVNMYQNTSNIIALLEGEAGFHTNGTIGTTLLVNCHYDSVPYALGASDNGIFCAVMVEILSKLSRRRQKFKHNIVFLFNGAEENSLQGSHPFLKHAWAKGVTNVINLDAAGMNGKPFVFQVTDPRLLSIYKRVAKRPAGQSLGEFLFQTGVIPSDTDFRIWRDFGHFHGIDIAFVKWGHVYHTRYDHPSLVHAGVIQNAGDMLLATVAAAADTHELATQVPPQNAVYYDFLYSGMAAYGHTAAIFVELTATALAAASVAYCAGLLGWRRTTFQELGWAVASRVAAMSAGILTCAILVPIMVATDMQLRYLTQPWVVVPHYWLPYAVTAVCVSQLFDAWRCKRSGLNRSIRTLLAQAATRLLLAVLLLVLTCVPSLTTMRYLFSVPLLMMSLASFVSLTLVRFVRLEAWHQLLLELTLSIPTTMFLFSMVLRFDALLLPIMGRSPIDTPDVTIALVNVGLAVLTCASVSGIELLFSRKRLWLAAAPVAVACLALMFVPLSPYNDDGPSVQRHYWFHSEIITYDQNNVITDRVAGVLVTKHDAFNTKSVLPALRSKGINLNARTDFSQDCERHVFCNLPIYRLRFGVYLLKRHCRPDIVYSKEDNHTSEQIEKFQSTLNKAKESAGDSVLLGTGPPAAFSPAAGTRVSARTCDAAGCTLTFSMTGPAHNTITIWPRENVNVTGWSLDTPLNVSWYQLSRPVYSIIQSYPTYNETFRPVEFSVQFSVPSSQQSQPIVDFSHHAFKINHPEDYTAEYRSLVEAMPKYFNIASFLAFRFNYVF